MSDILSTYGALLTFRSVEDGSPRYVAEDNIKPVDDEPGQGLMALAGQYFKRWDGETRSFVSNIRDEYPED